MIRERRLRRLAVAPELLINLTTGRFVVRRNGLPDDVEIRGIQYNPENGCIELLIEHASFEIVLPACRVPLCEPPVIERVVEKLANGS